MDYNKIVEQLCYHDPRNPDGVGASGEVEGKPKNCYCDNCFYGKTELAEEILRLRRLLNTHEGSPTS